MRIFIQGEFTKDELEEILLKIREIEQRDTNKIINVAVNSPNLEYLETLAIIRKIFPHWFELNYCQRCNTLYRKDKEHICSSNEEVMK